MHHSARCLLAIAGLSLAACAGDAGDATTDETPATDTAQAVTVTLAAQNNSGISGNATLTPQDGAVAVAAHVMGAEGAFAGQVYRGTCASLAQPATAAADLGTVNVGSGGMADHTATINMPIDSLANGQHAIAFRRGADGPVVACAEIPARTM